MEFVAKTLQGLEEILEKEIIDIGGKNVQKVKRAVKFEGDLTLLYRANYNLRTAIRILYKLEDFKIHSYADLYTAVYSIDWPSLFDINHTFSINSVANSKFFTHSKFVSQKSKDAVVDHFRDKFGRRPDVDIKNQDILIHIFINDRNLTVYLDSSGHPLFKRNYRQKTGEAPLNEVLAAGIIHLMNLQDNDILWDPMCGSGTFLSEAYMIANDIPPQILRHKFAFLNWKNVDKKSWIKVKNQHKENQDDKKFLNITIKGSDMDRDAVSIAKENIRMLDKRGDIKLRVADFFSCESDDENMKIVMNPPYDKRLELNDAVDFYKRIGDQLKQKCTGATAYIFSGNLQALKLLGLKPTKKICLFNGPIESKMHKYEIY